MPTPISLNLVDYSNEPSSVKFYGVTLDATNYAAVAADALAVRLGIEGVSLLNEKSMTASIPLHTASGVAPSDVLAQREWVMRVYFTDNVNGKRGTMTIPGPDTSLLTIVGDEVSLTTGTEMTALVDALNGHAFSQDGNAITVTRAVITGRNG
jgi:hypothetical protein